MFKTLYYDLNRTCLKIYESYRISKHNFSAALDYIKNCDDGNTKEFFDLRTKRSMINEWTCHNFLHRLGIETDRTEDVDFEYPQKPMLKILYCIGSILVNPFVE